MKNLILALVVLLTSFSFSQELIWETSVVISFNTSLENKIKTIEDFISLDNEGEINMVQISLSNKTFTLTETTLTIDINWEENGNVFEYHSVLDVSDFIKRGNIISFNVVSKIDGYLWSVNLDLNSIHNDNPFYVSTTETSTKIKGVLMNHNIVILKNTF
jgi:hypothetical protein